MPGTSGAIKTWALMTAVVLLTACASRGGYYKDDGPPRDHGIDIHSIPDAVPRDEPLSRTGNDTYTALGKRYTPMDSAAGYRARGTASWYGRKFHGRRTSSGEPYDMFAMTAAHRTLPLPTYVRVTNLRNGRSVVVRVNDRGPFLYDRLIDLSYAAAYKLGIIGRGTGRVEVSTVAGGMVRTAASSAGRSYDAPVSNPSHDAERYFIQFGAFTRSENARTLIRKLQQIGIIFAEVQQGNDGYFRVRSGPFSSATTAEYFHVRGAELGFSSTIVTE